MARQKYQLSENVFVYMEVDDEAGVEPAAEGSPDQSPLPGRPMSRPDEGGYGPKGGSLKDYIRKSTELTEVLKAVAANIPAAFVHAGGATVEKVTLSFGLKATGEVGIPLLTNASAEGSIGVVLECRYPETPVATVPKPGEGAK